VVSANDELPVERSQEPTEWSRIPHGALEGMRNSAEKPAGNGADAAPLVRKGLVCHWQALGPFDAPNPIQDFDLAPAGDESTLEPAPGRIADREWRKVSVPEDDILYTVDIYQTLYATDLKSGKMLYRQDLDLGRPHALQRGAGGGQPDLDRPEHRRPR